MKRSIAAVAVVGALAACREPDQRALGPALDGVNALGFYAFTGMLGAIATNGIPDIAAAPFAIARTPLPERILPTGAAIPGIAPPSVVAYIDRLGAPAAFDVAAAPAAGTVTLGGDELAIEVTDAIVDGFPLARDQVTACSVKGLDVHGAAVLDLDLDGADLNEVALVGVSLAGRADVASGVWVTGVSASSIRCTCAAGSGVELSACIPASAPYDLTVRVRAAPAPGLRMPISRLHVAVSEVNTDGTATATPLCESGVPVTQAGCTAAAGTFVNGACLVGDRDRDGIDGYVADGITVDSLAQHLRASAASAVKVAFDRKVVATLSCGARSYDFTGEIGVAGLFGGKRWIAGGGDPIVVEQERWHTATLMSLVNAFGQRVNVSLRHPSLGPTTFGSGAPRPPELRPFQAELDLDGDGAAEDLRAEFDKTDGTYYGNVFTGDCATSSHPDCQSPGVFNAVAFVRIADTDQQFIAVIADGISEGECAQRFAEKGLAFDPSRHFLRLAYNTSATVCTSDSRICAALPPLANFYCPLSTSGLQTDKCTPGTDPLLGYTECSDENANAPRTFAEQVTVYLRGDATRRYDVEPEIVCRSVNRLRISVGGCDDPAIADCDGDGVRDGCVAGTP